MIAYRTVWEGLFVLASEKLYDDLGWAYDEFSVRDLARLIGSTFIPVRELTFLMNENSAYGLHFQRGRSAQSRIVTLQGGTAVAYAIDMRLESQCYMKLFSRKLNIGGVLTHSPRLRRRSGRA